MSGKSAAAAASKTEGGGGCLGAGRGRREPENDEAGAHRPGDKRAVSQAGRQMGRRAGRHLCSLARLCGCKKQRCSCAQMANTAPPQ